MELGALICTPRDPQCPRCPLRAHCAAHRANRAAEFPQLAPRAAATARHFIAFVIEHRGKFLVRQRPPGQVNAHLWEFPNFELKPGTESPSRTDDNSPSPPSGERVGVRGRRIINQPSSHIKALAEKEFPFSLNHMTELLPVRHTITRYRITVQVFHAKLPTSTPMRSISTIPNSALRTPQSAISTPHSPLPVPHSSLPTPHSALPIWLAFPKLDPLPFTSAHRKILNQIQSRH